MVTYMSNQMTNGMVQSMSKSASIGEILKNALEWKQWMADDLRTMIKLRQEKGLDNVILLELMSHHLNTYHLLNTTFSMISGEEDNSLFDMPEIELLQSIIPELTLPMVETDIEPMLETKLDALSNELKNSVQQTTVEDNPSQPEPEKQDSDFEQTEQNDEPSEIADDLPELSTDVEIVIEKEDNSQTDNEVGEVVVQMDDSEVISNDQGEQGIEVELKTDDGETVEIVDQIVLAPEQVPVEEIKESVQKAPVEELSIEDMVKATIEPHETGTSDITSRLWDTILLDIPVYKKDEVEIEVNVDATINA